MDKLADIRAKIPENFIDEYVLKTCEKAMGGDVKAFEWILENIIGSENGSRYSRGIPGQLIGRDFIDIYRDIRERRHRFYNFKGGRGSLKSSFCALVLIDEIMRNKNFCGIALRQIKDTLESSVYAQLKWAVDMLELTDLFECKHSIPQIKKKDTGQIIYFRGCADPFKIKSIRPPKDMHIGVVWFEEKDQLKDGEAVRNILQSVMRGGGDSIILSSYNTLEV